MLYQRKTFTVPAAGKETTDEQWPFPKKERRYWTEEDEQLFEKGHTTPVLVERTVTVEVVGVTEDEK